MFNKLFTGALVATSSIATLINGQITEIDGIESVRDYLKEDALVLMNVGDTLFSPSCMLADNQWREYFVGRVKSLVSDAAMAQHIIDPVKAMIVEQIPKVCPEEVTPNFIADLQNQQVPVLGYTQRLIATTYAPNNGQITSNHLLGMGIDLEKTLSYYPSQEYRNEANAFQYGIIFTNKNPIGPAVTDFLASREISTSRVILVDDGFSELKEAEAALTNVGIEFQGLRYGRIDQRKEAFDSQLATLQFLVYIHENLLLKDEEAVQISLQNPNVNYEAQLDAWILQQASLTL